MTVDLSRPLAVLLAGVGPLHLIPQTAVQFDAIVPRSLPGRPRLWTVLSGLAELAIAGALLTPKTKKVGGGLAAALFVAVFPANIKMAADWRRAPAWRRVIAYGRLPLQLPLIFAALRVARGAGGGESAGPSAGGRESAAGA